MPTNPLPMPLNAKYGVPLNTIRLSGLLPLPLPSTSSSSSLYSQVDVLYYNSEDDFAEAVITLVNSIQNSICDFNLKLTDISENIQ